MQGGIALQLVPVYRLIAIHVGQKLIMGTKRTK